MSYSSSTQCCCAHLNTECLTLAVPVSRQRCLSVLVVQCSVVHHRLTPHSAVTQCVRCSSATCSVSVLSTAECPMLMSQHCVCQSTQMRDSVSRLIWDSMLACPMSETCRDEPCPTSSQSPPLHAQPPPSASPLSRRGAGALCGPRRGRGCARVYGVYMILLLLYVCYNGERILLNEARKWVKCEVTCHHWTHL